MKLAVSPSALSFQRRQDVFLSVQLSHLSQPRRSQCWNVYTRRQSVLGLVQLRSLWGGIAKLYGDQYSVFFTTIDLEVALQDWAGLAYTL